MTMNERLIMIGLRMTTMDDETVTENSNERFLFLILKQSKAWAGKVKKINNLNLHHNWINLPSGN